MGTTLFELKGRSPQIGAGRVVNPKLNWSTACEEFDQGCRRKNFNFLRGKEWAWICVGGMGISHWSRRSDRMKGGFMDKISTR